MNTTITVNEVSTKVVDVELCKKKIAVKRCVSVMPNDYNELDNLPKINGVELKGEMTSHSLSLLSSKPEIYETVSLLDAGKESRFVVVVGDGEPKKIPMIDFTAQITGFTTVDELNPDVAIGAYQFVAVQENKEGE